MKKIVFLLAFVFISNVLFAQYKPFQLGFKVSPTISWLNANDSGLKGEGTSIGFNGGFVAEFNFTENYMIMTGINYNYAKGKISYQKLVQENDTLSPLHNQICDISQTINFQYIEIPIALKLRTNEFGKVRFYGLMGINSAFCFNAKSDKTISYENDSKKIERENVKDDFTLMKESLLLGIGTELRVDQSSFLSIGVNFNTALNNIAKFNHYYEGAEKTAKSTLSFFELQIAFIF